MSVLKRENPEDEWGESVPSNGVQYGQIRAHLAWVRRAQANRARECGDACLTTSTWKGVRFRLPNSRSGGPAGASSVER